MIYFMQPVDGGPIKIGYSQNVEARHKQLENLYKKTLVVLAVMDGDYEEEQEWHERFSHLRFGRTEQFRPSLELLEAIGNPEITSINSDTVEVIPSHYEGAVVRIDSDIVSRAKYIASINGISMSKFLSDYLRPMVERKFDEAGKALFEKEGRS